MAVVDGGLDRSKDREIDSVKTEIKKLATKVDQVAFTQKLIHDWNPKRCLIFGFR